MKSNLLSVCRKFELNHNLLISMGYNVVCGVIRSKVDSNSEDDKHRIGVQIRELIDIRDKIVEPFLLENSEVYDIIKVLCAV